MAKVLRRILAVLCLLAAVFFLLPLGIGILHFGMVWPAALLLLCAAWLTWPDFFRRLLRPKWLRALVGCVIAVCMTAILVTLGKMAMAAADRPADGQDCTVVVLGCQVFPDGHPSLMLRGRINAAYDYLTAHPDALCIASGGQNGSPCQDLSVAGARAGLAGARSGLFMEQMRIVREMRLTEKARGRESVNIRPRWMCWENGATRS